MGLPAAMAGVQLATSLGGLFGHHGDNGASQYRSDEMKQLHGLGDVASQYGDLGQEKLGQAKQYGNQYSGAVQRYGDYLGQDPFTDQRDASDLSRATAGTTQAYQQARANLQQNSYLRGLDTPSSSGASSVYGGAEAGIESGQAAALGNAQNQLAYNRIAQRGQNMGAQTNLYGGAQSQAYGQGMSALGSQAGVEGNIAGQYGNLANNAQSQQQQYNQQLMGGLGQAGQDLGYGQGYKNAPQLPSLYGGGGYPGGVNGGGQGSTGFGLHPDLQSVLAQHGSGSFGTMGGNMTGGAYSPDMFAASGY